MTRVRLFFSGRPIGFIAFTDTGYRVRPVGVLSPSLIEAIGSEVEANRPSGSVGGYTWDLQAFASCPLDDAKPCPCDDEICRFDGTTIR